MVTSCAGNPAVQDHGKWLAFRLTDGDQTGARLFLKFPVIVTGGRGIAIPERLRFPAQPVRPGFAVELERVAGILALVHLAEIFFAEPDVFKREFSGIGLKVNFHLIVPAHTQGDATLLIRPADLEPPPRTSLMVQLAVGGEVEIGKPLPRAGDRNGVSGAGRQ